MRFFMVIISSLMIISSLPPFLRYSRIQAAAQYPHARRYLAAFPTASSNERISDAGVLAGRTGKGAEDFTASPQGGGFYGLALEQDA
jgi:hypothetical protein